MKLRHYIAALGLLLTASGAVSAGEPAVVTSIEQSGVIRVVMPEALASRLESQAQVAAPAQGTNEAAAPSSSAEARPTAPAVTPSHTGGAYKGPGYRIQVFSDNNSRTAKAEARTRQRNISSQFPEMGTYVVYNSPYWRLRVGNFRTQEEANAAAADLKSAFPAYSKEIRVVRDRITIAD